jgi:hypothetical protein
MGRTFGVQIARVLRLGVLVAGLGLLPPAPASAGPQPAPSDCGSPDPLLFTSVIDTPVLTILTQDPSNTVCDSQNVGVAPMPGLSSEDGPTPSFTTAPNQSTTGATYIFTVNSDQTEAVYNVSVASTTLAFESTTSDTVTVFLDPNFSGTYTVPLAIQLALPVPPPVATTRIASTSLKENLAAPPFTPVIDSGGLPPITFAISPMLPPGLSFSTTTGAISGTPIVTSPPTIYTVTVTSGHNFKSSSTFTLAVTGPTVTQAVASASLKEGVAATSFTPVTGSGGTGALGFSLSPSLPAGLNFSTATGAITGTPASASTASSFTVTATDSAGANASASFSLAVTGPTVTQAIASTSLNENVAATAFTPVTGTGGSGALTFSVSAALPAGLSFSTTTGAITGTPTSPGAAARFTVTVTDMTGANGSAGFSLAVTGPVVMQAVASTTLTAGRAAASFTPVTATGGTGALTYSVSPSLPGGLMLSARTGAVTGTPSTPMAATNFIVTVTDSNGAKGSAGFKLTVLAPLTAEAPALATSLTANHAATPFTPVTGSGGVAPLSYSISPGLPTGLGLAANTGTISGTPTIASPAATYTVTVTDATNATASASFRLTVNSTVTASQAIASTSLAVNQTVTPFTPVTGAGGTAPLTYAIQPNLSVGLGFAAGTGIVTGTPLVTSAAMSYAVTVTDANGASASASFSLTVSPAASTTVLTSSLDPSVFGQKVTFTAQVNGSGATAPTGSVTFKDGTATLFTAALGGHQANFTTASLVVGSHAITVSYGGDGNFAGSTSGTVTQRVNPIATPSGPMVYSFQNALGVTGMTSTDNAHFSLPSSAFINPAGQLLYIADTGNQRVQIFDAATLGYVATIGTTAVSGSDNDHFNQPQDAELNPSTNQIMVADSGNGRIQLFDATTLVYDATLGQPGAGPAAADFFGKPVSAAFDPTTNLVLVADAGIDARVQVFDAPTYDFVLTLGTTGSAGAATSQFNLPAGIAIDPLHAHIFIGDTQNDRVDVFSIAPSVNFASVLPAARSVQLGHPATIFATRINAGSSALDNCLIALPVTAPAGLTLSYQTTNPGTNALTGTVGTPAPIPGNDGSAGFLVSFQATEPFTALSLPLDFECLGVAPAAIDVGVDTVDLVESSTPVADIIALAATPGGNGIAVLPIGGAGAFAVASANVGVAAPLTVSVDTGAAVLPVTATICQSNPSTGQCLATPAGSVTLNYAAGATPTFSVFLQATGPIAFAPATSRVFVRFEDAGGGPHGATSVAIETQ